MRSAQDLVKDQKLRGLFRKEQPLFHRLRKNGIKNKPLFSL